MDKTNRRSLLKIAAASGAAVAFGAAIQPETSRGKARIQQNPGTNHDDQHRPIYGPLANATINFGSWQTDPAFDRFAALSPPNPANTPNDPNPIQPKPPCAGSQRSDDPSRWNGQFHYRRL